MTRQTCSRRKQWSGPRPGFFLKNEPWLWCGQLFLRREQQSQPRVLHLKSKKKSTLSVNQHFEGRYALVVIAKFTSKIMP